MCLKIRSSICLWERVEDSGMPLIMTSEAGGFSEFDEHLQVLTCSERSLRIELIHSASAFTVQIILVWLPSIADILSFMTFINESSLLIITVY